MKQFHAEEPQTRSLFGSALRELLFGFLLVLIGIVAMIVGYLRWKPDGATMMSFGALCILYGARTRAFPYLFDLPPQFTVYALNYIVYLVPVPGLIFAEQLVGKGWKSTIRLALYGQIIFAAAAIILGIYFQKPHIAQGLPNSLMSIICITVILIGIFQPGLEQTRELKAIKLGFVIFGLTAVYTNIADNLAWLPNAGDLEEFGFLIVLSILLYIVARRFFDNEKKLVTIHYELETARQIQSFILPQESVNVKDLEVAARYLPMSSVAGDFYDFAVRDEKSLGILVADVSGHGVPASLISSMVKIAFANEKAHAHDPARVLAGLNKTLCGKLESDFVTAGYLFFDSQKQQIVYSAAGHPPMLVWRKTSREIIELGGKGVILGQIEDVGYKNIGLELQTGDRLFLFTDGIIEFSNITGDLFGWERLKAFIDTNGELSADQIADELIRHLKTWSGRNSEDALEDDLTLIVVDYSG